MNKVLRSSAVLAVSMLSVPLWAVPTAAAASSTEPASSGAYFYSAGIDKPEQVAVQPPNVTGDRTDGVAPEHLAAAVRVPNQVDKQSFLAFDLASVPFDATITKAVVTVPLAENGNGNMVMSPGPGKVRACAANDEGFNGEDGANLTTSSPTFDCGKFEVVPTESADKRSYVFDITGLASLWLSEANNGMAITPKVLTSPFQVVFLPFDQSKLTVEFTAPPTETITEDFTADVPVSSTGSGSGSVDAPAIGGFDSGSGSVDAPSIDSGGGFGAVDAPVIDSGSAPLPDMTDPLAADDPAAAAPEVAGAPITNAAASFGGAPLTPPATFWLGSLLVAALLALLSLIMGDPRVPAQQAGSQTRLSRALEQRQRAGLGRSAAL